MVPSGKVVKILNRGSLARVPPLIVPPAEGRNTESTVTARRELAGVAELPFNRANVTSATLVPFARSLKALEFPGLKKDVTRSPRMSVTFPDPMRSMPVLPLTGVPAVSTPASCTMPVPPATRSGRFGVTY